MDVLGALKTLQHNLVAVDGNTQFTRPYDGNRSYHYKS